VQEALTFVPKDAVPLIARELNLNPSPKCTEW
jgi:hypothetical protein